MYHNLVISSVWLKVVPYTSGKIWSARLIFLFFLAVCLNISTVINIKILTNSSQQTQSYKFTSHIAAFLCGFDHRDAWNLYTNIIWSKRSTDFNELSPCSVWYPLKHRVFNKSNTTVVTTRARTASAKHCLPPLRVAQSFVLFFCPFSCGHWIVCR